MVKSRKELKTYIPARHERSMVKFLELVNSSRILAGFVPFWAGLLGGLVKIIDPFSENIPQANWYMVLVTNSVSADMGRLLQGLMTQRKVDKLVVAYNAIWETYAACEPCTYFPNMCCFGHSDWGEASREVNPYLVEPFRSSTTFTDFTDTETIFKSLKLLFPNGDFYGAL